MLQIETVTFGYFSIHSLLDPVYGIDHLVPPSLLHHIDRPLEFCINHPNKKKPLFLQHRYRYLLNSLIPQAGILNCNSPGRLGTRQSPGWIHHYHIELSVRHLQLLLYQILEVKFSHIRTYGNRIITHI